LGYHLIAVGRRQDRLDALRAELPAVSVRTVAADLDTDEGIEAVARICAAEPLDMLVNNAGVSHYMAFADLPADKLAELLHVKVVAPTTLARAAVPGMVGRGRGTASLAGLTLGEVVCAPGVERGELLDTARGASVAAFGGQSPSLAARYRAG
jgi:short-subunit dehydrogenase